VACISISGTISSSGTRYPDGTTVSGGCPTCSGSHWVYYTYSFSRACPSGIYNVYTAPNLASTGSSYLQDLTGDSLTPLYFPSDLIAYHPLDETSSGTPQGSLRSDYSGNRYDAYAFSGVTSTSGFRGYGAATTSGIISSTVPVQFTDSMISFIFKPSQLLTSGIALSFPLIRGYRYSGDTFTIANNWNTVNPYRGWAKTGSPVSAFTDSLGFHLQSAANQNWFNVTQTTTAIYCETPESDCWEIEQQFYQTSATANNQATGLLIFDKNLASNYGSIILMCTGTTSKITVQTGNYSYDIVTGLPNASSSVKYSFGILKVGNLLYFKYSTAPFTSWTQTPYTVDVSTWSSTIRIGFHNRNSSGTAPVTIFSGLYFVKGSAPSGVGDANDPGYFEISYNSPNVKADVGPRTDSRIWFSTTPSGFAQGSSTYTWDPSKYYLIQVGFIPNARPGDYEIWVNGRKERTAIVGSGIGADRMGASGTGSYRYFGSWSPFINSVTSPGIIDDVALWGRRLTNVEILKLYTNTSSITSAQTISYIPTSEHVLEVAISLSGSHTERTVATSIPFNWSTNYISSPPTAISMGIHNVDYSIRRTCSVMGWRINPFTLNIKRCSSGWYHMFGDGCFACMTSTSGCACDVKTTIGIYKVTSRPTVTSSIYALNRLVHVINREITTGAVQKIYRIPVYDLSGPYVTSVPDNNERMISESFSWYSPSQMTVNIREIGSTLSGVDTRVWVKHNRAKRNSYLVEDNFNFYQLDFKATTSGINYPPYWSNVASGEGWNAINWDSPAVTKFLINENFNSTVTATNLSVSTSGIDNSLVPLTRNFRSDPSCNVLGSRCLEIATSSGIWGPASGTRTAPYAYWVIPSGIGDWEVTTKLRAERNGDVRGQYAGLMCTYTSYPPTNAHIVQSASGIMYLVGSGTSEYIPKLTYLNSVDNIWFKIAKTSSSLDYYWSPNGQAWSNVYSSGATTTGIKADMTSNTAPYPYGCAASSIYSATYDAWKAFNSTNIDTNDCWHSNASQVLPQWISYTFPQPVSIDGYKMRARNDAGANNRNFPKDVQLQGSNNYSTWITVVTGGAIPDPGQANWAPSSGYFPVSGCSFYKYYRLWITRSATGTALACLNELVFTGIYSPKKRIDSDFMVGPIVISDPSVRGNATGKTVAYFDYVKFTTSGSITYLSGGDSWELVLDGSSPLNSVDNSGYSFFDPVSTSNHQFMWSPKTPFDFGESVYYRVEACDQPALKVDYPISDSTLIFIKAELQDNLPVSSLLGGTDPPILDSSNYNNRILSSGVVSTSGIAYQGMSAYSGSPTRIYTDLLNYPLSDWTYHAMVYPTTTFTGSVISISPASGVALGFTVSGTGLTVFSGTRSVGTIGPLSITTKAWNHIAIVRDQGWVYALCNGYKTPNPYYIGNALTVSGAYTLTMASGYNGLLDLMVFESKALWNKNFITGAILDEIRTFRAVSKSDLNLDMSIVSDTNAPKVMPVVPVDEDTNVCIESAIVFDVLDDFVGVDWTQTVITIDGLTVFSGGNNLTEFYKDRGILTFEERGQYYGEWHYVEPLDGVNRLLYPPGTVYDNSGAWGRRFTYHTPYDLDYFGRTIIVTVSGTDDQNNSNDFVYTYSFTNIENTNLVVDNFFMNVGESELIDILVRVDRHLTCDLVDLNYPTTDIDETRTTLTMHDGYHDVTCSGVWFTNYVNPSGILVHTLHWRPDNEYDWDGHRTMQFTVTPYNDHPTCNVYNQHEYKLLYGWELVWMHDDKPFDYDKKVFIFVDAKTDVFKPSSYGHAYPVWTVPPNVSDLGVSFKPQGRTYSDLSVSLIAQSQALQYSENVVVEVWCEDLDGNELYYSWSFDTEPKPS
jgi:hypothetical protein